MNHTARKSFWHEVRDAALETPRLYLEGARDIAHAFRRLTTRHDSRTSAPETIAVIHPGRKVASGRSAPSSLRLGKKNRRLRKLHTLDQK